MSFGNMVSINGQLHPLPDDPRVSLLDLLRHRLGLAGTKKGCDHGQCGACTVIVNGIRINSCLSLAVMHDGDEVITIEGLGTPDEPSAMQKAFLEHDGFQCGYCTPGQICSATAMLEEIAANWPSDASDTLEGEIALSGEEIRERMSGNLCRCGAYANIVAAIREVAENHEMETGA
jgi:xanthine dehydrogenase YagT iron-sulfur-binding subunit